MLVARVRFGRLQRAAVRIQAMWRGWLVREEMASWPVAATRIATAWLRSRARRRYLATVWAGSVIVSAAITRRHVQIRRARTSAVSIIAAAWRCYRSQDRVNEAEEAARRIQRTWRDVILVRGYQNMCVDVLVQGKKIRDAYLEQHVLVIQRCFRRWSLRRHALFTRQRRAAIKLQAFIRRRFAKRHADAIRARLPLRVSRYISHSVVLVPDRWGRLTKSRDAHVDEDPPPPPRLRRKVLRVGGLPEHQRLELGDAIAPLRRIAKFMFFQLSILTIQRHWRGFANRRVLARRHAAATRLQRAWRKRESRRLEGMWHSAVVRIQAAARRTLGVRRPGTRSVGS